MSRQDGQRRAPLVPGGPAEFSGMSYGTLRAVPAALAANSASLMTNINASITIGVRGRVLGTNAGGGNPYTAGSDSSDC
jgi:hypothetical protein